MNRKWITRIGISLLVAAGLVAVGGLAFRAGQRHDGVEVARDLVVGDDSARTVIVEDGWRGWHGGGPGFGFGFLFFPLVIVGLVLLFSRRGRWSGGPWRSRDEELREWHRRAHADDTSAAPTPPTSPTDHMPPPSGA
jgi:hypothetical protein